MIVLENAIYFDRLQSSRYIRYISWVIRADLNWRG